MQFTRICLKNWRNFRSVDVPLRPRTFVLGANASGKSNFFNVFRFLRTLARSEGGGLQKAVRDHGGMKRLRSLHARQDTEVMIEVEVSDDSTEPATLWYYQVAIKSEGRGQQRPLVSREIVRRDDVVLLDRPNDEDHRDRERLTETDLEQVGSNREFRELADYFASTTYLHLVPQLLRHADEIAARIPESDPFGQGLMQRIAQTPRKTRDARLRRIQKALLKAVPMFSELRFEQDQVTGLWHLEANFAHWRGNGAWQREDQLSDGTLRLIGLLWALQEGDHLLLLEEPELSLNEEIVTQIPLLIDRILRDRKKGRSAGQVLLSTHSDSLLENVPEDAQMLLIETGADGSTIRAPDADEELQLLHGLNPAEVLLPKTRPKAIAQLGFWE